jgi:acid phosphatase type 7
MCRFVKSPLMAGFALLTMSVVSNSSVSYSKTVTVFAAGDVATCPSPGGIRGKISFWYAKLTGAYIPGGHLKTGKLLDDTRGLILGLGDFAYNAGSEVQYRDCYSPGWGRHRSRIRPTPGNHDYWTPDAKGYFDYFGDAAGPRDKGYYSFDHGAWHIISLNPYTKDFDGQASWLKSDLSSARNRCILAFWHQPYFSVGKRGGEPKDKALYDILYDGGVSIVLAGHEHQYSRFSPQNPQGQFEINRGIRQFVVGTGGSSLNTSVNAELPDTLESLILGQWGVLKLVLHEKGYRWDFLTVDPNGPKDKGSSGCVERP